MIDFCRFILRNYIAQSVIEKCENQDFVPINNILKLLETPYEDQFLESNIDQLTLSEGEGNDNAAQPIDTLDFNRKGC